MENTTVMSSKDFESFKSSIVEKLKHDALVLPTPPNVAMRVQKALNDNPDINADELSSLIQTDSALSIGIMKVANTVYISKASKPKSLSQAVARIGLNRIRSLVFKLAMEQMFISNDKFAALKLKKTWESSLDVAAFSLALKSTHPNKKMFRSIDADVLTLISISHQIGLLPVYVELSSGNFDVSDKSFVLRCEMKLNSAFTKKILTSWGMDEEIIQGASGWMHLNPWNGVAQYSDIIRLATLEKNGFWVSKEKKQALLSTAIEKGLIPDVSFLTKKEFSEKYSEIRSALS